MNPKQELVKQATAKVVLSMLFLALVIGAQAVTLTWGTTGGGGPGTWDNTGSSANWYDGAGAVAWPNSGNDDAIFAGTASTVTNLGTVASPIYVQNLIFNTANYTIVSNTLTLGLYASPTISNAVTATINSGLVGSGGLTKAGAGTLTLGGTNTYTGGTFVNAGTLSVSADNRLGAVPASAEAANITLNGGTLLLGNFTVSTTRGITLGTSGGILSGSGYTYGGIIAGSSSLTISNTSGTASIGGQSTYTGGTVLKASGGLVVPTVSTLGATYGSPDSGPFGTGSAPLNLAGSQMRATTGADTTVGNTVTISATTTFPTVASEKSLIFSGPVTIVGATRTLTNNIGATEPLKALIFTGAIGDGGSGYGLIKAGTGLLKLAGANTFTGPTGIGGGKLYGVSGGSSVSAVTVSNTAGAAFGVSVTDNTKAYTSGSVTFAGASSGLDFDFGYTGSPSTTLSPLQINGNVAFTGTPIVAIRASTLANGKYPLMTWTGTVTGTPPTTPVMPHIAGSLSVEGNTLFLTVTGTTQPLTWNAATAAANWDINTTANWKDATGATGQKYTQSSIPGEAVVFDDSLAPAGPLTVTLATVAPANVLVNNASKNYTFTGGAIAGGTALTKSGAGSLTLITPSTYTGLTTINAGTVVAQNNAALGAATAGTIVNSGATLDLGGALAAGGLNLGTELVTISGPGVGGAGALVNNSANDQINAVQKVVMAANANIGGIKRWDIRGTSSTLDMGRNTLTKVGTNYVALVYTAVSNPGNFDISNGMLGFQLSANLGGSSANSITIRNAGTLETYQLAAVPTWSLMFNNGSTFYAESGSAAQNTWAGPVTVDGAVTLNAAGVLTISGDISGSGALTKIGGSTVTLSGNNSYSGGTTITNGIVIANSSMAFGTGLVTVNSNTTRVVINDGFTLGNNIRLNGSVGATGRGVFENSGSGVATLSGGIITITNTPGAGGHFASVSGGTLDIEDPINSTVTVSFRTGNGVFGGGGSYSNFLMTGNVRLGANNGLSTLATVDVGTSGAATFDLAGYHQTLAGITRTTGNSATILNNFGTSDSLLTLTGTSVYPGIIADGTSGYRVALTISSGASLTLSGANTYTGDTTINAGGSLQVGAGLAAGQLGSGAVINDGSLLFTRSDNVTAANVISGTGKLVKDGTGTLSLTGLNTYSGLTVVSNGTLNVRTDATGGGAYAVSDGLGRKLGVTLHADGAALAVSSLAFGAGNHLALDMAGATTSLLGPVVTSSGAVTLNGDVVVDVTMDAAGLVFTAPNSYVLITCGSRSGSGTFLGGILPTFPGYSSRIVDSGSEVRLVFELPSNDLLWTGNVGPNWNLSDLNWVLNGTTTVTNFSKYDTTRFDDTAVGSGTVSVNIPTQVVPGGITVSNETRDYVFTGSAIAQSASLVKEGVAKLTLANNNTYVGATSISNGVVEVGSGGTTGSLGTGPVANESLLVFNRSDSYTNVAAVGGIGSVVQKGTGTLVLPLANTYSGGTVITNGVVNVPVAGGLGTGAVTVNAPGGLDLTAPSSAVTLDYTGLTTSLAGNGTVNVVLGTNTQTVGLNADKSGFTGIINVGTNAVAGAGKVQMNSAPSSAATVNLLSNATLYANGAVDNPASLFLYGGDTGEALGQLRLDSGASWSGPITLAGSITSTNDGFVGANSGVGTITGNIGEVGGSRALIKVGGGTTVLAGNNTYTGGTTNKGGVLTVANGSALGTGLVTLTTNGVRLVVNDDVTVTNDIVINGGGATGRGTIENSSTGNATLSGGTITINGPLAGGGHFASATGGTLTVVDPVNSATLQVAKRFGTVIFSGGGSYTNFSADQGATVLGANNGLSTAATVDIGISGAANVDLAGYSQTLVAIKRSSANAVFVTNSSTVSDSRLTLTGVSTYPGSLNDSGVSGSRIALAVNGGNVTLSGANTFSGGSFISSSGVLTATLTNTLGTAGVTNDGTLNLTAAGASPAAYTGLSYPANYLSGTGTVNVTLGTGSQTVALNGNNSGFHGVLNIGTNGVTGAPAVAGSGKVQLNGALGLGAVVKVLSNATLYVSTAVTQAVPVTLYGGDPGEVYGQLRLEAGATWSGPVILAGDITGAGDGFLGCASGVGTISGNISEVGGSRAVTKLQTQTIVLSGENSYSGLTTVSAGALRVQSPTALGTTAAGTVVAAGASLQIQGGITVTGEALTIAGDGGGAGALRNMTNENTWAANISIGTNALTRIASDTNLLTINGNVALSTTATDALVLQGGGDITVNGVISGVAGLTSSSGGTGIRTLTGANTYTGTTIINGGTLRVTGSLGSTTVTNIAGILSGNGTIAGPVLVESAATLEPGVSSALGEVLTINNKLTLAGTAHIQIGAAGACDKVAGVTDITYGGTLLVTNATGATLAAGEVFQLFSASGLKTGNFTNIVVLPPLPVGVTNSFDPATGQLSLVALTGPTLVYSNTGSALEFSWTGSYKLQVQTNSLDVGISNNWVDYPGGGTSPVSVPLDASQPSVFFRLAQP